MFEKANKRLLIANTNKIDDAVIEVLDGPLKFFPVVIGFFIASFADTTVIWNVSLITIALMTIPNLIGLLWLRQEVKSTVKDYWINFKKEWPNENTPE